MLSMDMAHCLMDSLCLTVVAMGRTWLLYTSPMELKDSNVVAYNLADGTTFIIRPSGTEPKIKVYVLAHGWSQAECDEKLAKYTAFADVIKTMA